MADRTWQFELKRKGKHFCNIFAKMKKDQAEILVSLLSKPLEIEKHRVELCGIIGGEERKHEYYTPFSEQNMINPESYAEDIERYALSFPEIFTLDNYKDVLKVAKDVFDKHVHIKDSRKTQEEHDNDIKLMNERVNKYDEERRIEKEKEKIEEEKLIKQYPYLETIHDTKKSRHALCSSNIKKLLAHKFPGMKFSVKSDSFSMGDSVDVNWTDGPTEKEVNEWIYQFNNSSFDGMTDSSTYIHSVWHVFGSSKYVSSNRHISKEAYIKASTATSIPIIFHEKQDVPDYTKMDRYDLRNIDDWLRENSLYVKPNIVSNSQTNSSNKEVGVSRNEEKGGIEIRFNSKPDTSILTKLKENGWRWSRFAKVWWHRYTENDWQFANSIVE